jgi:hypothetical protein
VGSHAQAQLQSLRYTVENQPGMLAGVAVSVNNDLQYVGQQLIGICQLCDALENTLEQQYNACVDDKLAQQASFDLQKNLPQPELLDLNYRHRGSCVLPQPHSSSWTAHGNNSYSFSSTKYDSDTIVYFESFVSSDKNRGTDSSAGISSA